MLIKWENFGAFLSCLRREVFLTGFFLSRFHRILIVWEIFGIKLFLTSLGVRHPKQGHLNWVALYSFIFVSESLYVVLTEILA
jgi:hypothetical protein